MSVAKSAGEYGKILLNKFKSFTHWPSGCG